MNKDALQSLAMGGVLVVLAYAAYNHFKPATAAKRPAQGAGGAVAPSMGVPDYMTSPQQTKAPYTGSPFTALENIFTGVTEDVGAFQGRNYLNEMAAPLLNGSTVKRDSVFVDDGYQWARS